MVECRSLDSLLGAFSNMYYFHEASLEALNELLARIKFARNPVAPFVSVLDQPGYCDTYAHAPPAKATVSAVRWRTVSFENSTAELGWLRNFGSLQAQRKTTSMMKRDDCTKQVMSEYV